MSEELQVQRLEAILKPRRVERFHAQIPVLSKCRTHDNPNLAAVILALPADDFQQLVNSVPGQDVLLLQVDAPRRAFKHIGDGIEIVDRRNDRHDTKVFVEAPDIERLGRRSKQLGRDEEPARRLNGLCNETAWYPKIGNVPVGFK